MKENEAVQLVSQTFTKSFSEEQFVLFIRNLLPGLEAPSSRTVPNAQIPQGFREHVHSYTRLGTYRDLQGNVLDVVIVKLKSQGSLDRARTRQRNLMAHYLKIRGKDAALVAYIADDLADWRFSYVKLAYQTEISDKGKVKVKSEFTPARRYSFLVGENEPTHTAQKQLGKLLMKEVMLTIEQIEDAFNIESVTKEFFEGYKGLFLQIKDNLDQIIATSEQVKAEFERCNVESDNFAKKLLGQIVFLYFLQKKGWLGVAQDAAWGTGDKKFLHNLFKNNKEHNYFDDILEPFFYEALAIERNEDFYHTLQCKVPFLNGGLFEPLNGYDWNNTPINLDNQVFEQIFKTFNLYNFTVREDEPLEREVAVDPEMLGKVFENLLEIKDRKSQGAYYTPREIVHYMCQESLINYLDTALNTETLKVAKEDIERFIREGDTSLENDLAKEAGRKSGDYGLPESIREYAKEIDFSLADVKICDPAIGSGAFPVGMMTEIVRARRVLTLSLPSQRNRDSYIFKWHCIENSLYGVDIDASAVEIAKLRLWLSLIVDEESYDHIRPLPNLDYRIVCGNSLLNANIEVFLKFNLFKELQMKKSQYFLASNQKSKEIIKIEIEKLINEIIGKKGLFDYRVYFSEVMIDRDGFNVIIGNPPYIDSERMTNEMPDERKLLSNIYSTTRGNWDYYIPFWESSIKNLNNSGCACLITPNKWLVATYGKKLRDYIANKIESISDFSSFRVFENVGAFPIVVAVKKTKSSNKIRVEKYNKGFTLGYYKEIKRDMLTKQPIWGMLISKNMNILLKMMGARILLSDVCSIENPFTVSEAYKFLPLLNSYQTKSEYDPRRDYKFINTGTIDPFINFWGSRDTRYIKKRFLFPYVEKSKFSNKFGDNRESQAASKKLIFSGMRYFEVYYDEMGEWIAGKSTVIARNFSREYSGRMLLGLLNSKTVKFFMYETYKFLGMDGGIGFSTTNIATIPLPNIDQSSNALTNCVDNLLEKISHNHEDVKSILESHDYVELNSLVYQLYELTEEEIAIVEDSVGR